MGGAAHYKQTHNKLLCAQVRREINLSINFKPVYVWPSGIDRALFCAQVNIEEFAKEHRLPFIRHEEEGLGWYSCTFFSLSDIDYIAVVEHDDNPKDPYYGASIHIDSDIKPSDALIKVCSAMGLNQSDLTWTYENAE